MNYIELTVSAKDTEQAEIIMADLSDFPFDSFNEENGSLKAYIRETDFDAVRNQVSSYLNTRGVRYTESTIPATNWNAVWEANFEPIVVDDRCYIRAPFHPKRPEYEYEIVIMPKMSFGTGHHATTCLMVSALLGLEVQGLHGLDMGSGTGILAILAAMRGAAQVDAIDNDEWAYENGSENVKANGVDDRVRTSLGDASLLGRDTYDFILANINRNILLADMQRYVEALHSNGTLIMSGILEADIPAIEAEARRLGLAPEKRNLRNGWAAVRCRKLSVHQAETAF